MSWRAFYFVGVPLEGMPGVQCEKQRLGMVSLGTSSQHVYKLSIRSSIDFN